MLKNNFYRVIKTDVLEEGQQKIRIQLNPDHTIFEGHFPEMPVVPGVCMVQILKELAEQMVHKNFQMSKAPVIKFLAVLQPEKHPEVDITIGMKEIADQQYRVTSNIAFETTTFFKFKGNFYGQ